MEQKKIIFDNQKYFLHEEYLFTHGQKFNHRFNLPRKEAHESEGEFSDYSENRLNHQLSYSFGNIFL